MYNKEKVSSPVSSFTPTKHTIYGPEDNLDEEKKMRLLLRASVDVNIMKIELCKIPTAMYKRWKRKLEQH